IWGDPTTTDNLVEGNLIGTDLLGTHPLGNALGVGIAKGANHNTVRRNLISGNTGGGVAMYRDPATDYDVVEGNTIGTDITGKVGLGNSGAGVSISSDANHNTIGGSDPGARNLISGNGNDGVFMSDSGTNDNLVQGNYIGTTADGNGRLGNG